VSGTGPIDPRWLDMSRYPSLDPDQVLAGPVLGTVRDILHTAGLTPLSSETWAQVLHGAFSADPQPDSPAGAQGNGERPGSEAAHEGDDRGHPGSAAPEPGHEQPPWPHPGDPREEPPPHTDPHPGSETDGGHWW
jgi:hypothetical protein